MAESFRKRDAAEEEAFLQRKEAPHQETAQSVLVVNRYSVEDASLSAPNGRQVDVKRVRVIKRVSAGGEILDPENASGYTDYYKPEETKKLQVVLHFTAGSLTGSLGILTAGRHHPHNPGVGVHYVVSTRGTVFELVEDKFWGNSSSAGNFNRNVVSIEIINPGPLLRQGATYVTAEGHGFICDQEEGKDWVYDFGSKPYRGYSLYYKYTPEQYGALRRLLAYIGAKHAIPLKLLPDDHPESPEDSRRYKCLGEETKSFAGIVSHVNYVANGKWDIGPAFEWTELFERALFFPFQSRNEPISNPVSVYANNETHEGGSFVAGSTYNVHGGIHLFPATAPAAVRAMAPGVVLAARLAPADADAETLRFTGNHNGFVLLKHLIQEKDQAGRDTKAPFPIYSLYMHLAYPAWSGESTDPYAGVPWVRRLLQARNGAMVDVRPGEPTFGEILWVKTQGMEKKDARPCSVYKPDSMDSVQFPLRSGQRLNGVFKSSPAELRRGYEALKEGHIITFHLPYLFVAQGEIIGHIARLPNPASPPPFLHWEIFSPAGGQSGLRKLLVIAKSLDGKIKDVADASEDNFLDETDFKDLLKPLAKEERDLIQSILDEHHEGYAKQVFEQRSKHNETFSAQRPVDVAEPAREPFYVLALEVARKSAQCAVEPGEYPLDLQFQGEDGTVLGKASVPFQFGSADTATVHVPVPAAAAKLVVSSSDLFVDPAMAPPPGPDPVAEDLKLLCDDLLDHRWRNVLLEHVTEWSQAGLTKLFRDHPAAVRPFTLEKVLPITWWGRTSGDFGEVPVLGDGNSIFAKDILPKEGKIHNLHPVTALWVLHALLDHGKIALATEPTRFEGLQNPEIMYRGWTAETARVGDPLFALVIRKDFDSSETAVFTAKGPDEELTLGSARYGDGVAKLAVRAAFWGKWELKVPSKAPAQRTVHDDVAQWWKDVSGGSPGPTTVEVAAPKLASLDLPERVPGSAGYSLRLQFADNCPKAIHGLVFFKCARVAASAAGSGKPPDPPSPPAPDSFVLCPKAVVVAGAKEEMNLKGLSYETSGGYRFITGAERSRGAPVASAHLPFKAYQDAWKHKDEKFRLSVELVRRIERLFCLWDRRATLQVSRRELRLTALASDGLSITITPAFRFTGAPAERAHAEAAEFDALVAEAREMEKHPWEPTKVVSADAASRQLTLAVEHPQPRPDSGDLVVQFDPGPLVDDFVKAAGGAARDRIFVSAGFYGPNGGEYAISAYKHETADIIELSSDVQGRIARGERGVVAQPVASAPLLTFDHVAFASAGSAMARDGIEIFAVGGGLAPMWEKIHVEVSNGGARFPCARTGVRFSTVLKKKELTALGVVGQESVQFDVQVAQGADIRYGAASTPVQVNLKPSLASFSIVEPAKMSPGDPAKAVFAALKTPDAYLCLLGKARCMPVDAWLKLKCLEGPSFKENAALTRAIAWAASDSGHPVCDKDGNFGAWIAKAELRKHKGVELRFAWSREKDVWGVQVTSPAPQPSVRFDGETIAVVSGGKA